MSDILIAQIVKLGKENELSSGALFSSLISIKVMQRENMN